LRTIPLNTGDVAGAFNLNLSLSNYFRFKLTANSTLTFTNFSALAGKSAILEIEQDGTGTWTLGYASPAQAPGGSFPVVTTTAGAIDLVRVEVNYNGSVVHVSGIGQAYA
jgi:hypothetical protein